MNHFFTLLFIFISFSTFSQSNFVAATITKLNGETVSGKIDYREWVITPQEIRFKPTEAEKIETYTPHDILDFKINNNQEEYKRVIVGINREPVRQFESVNEIDPVLKLDIDTVFLLVLVKGRVNLYYLQEEQERVHYFIQKNIGRAEELIYRAVEIKESVNPIQPLNETTPTPSAFYRTVFFEDYKKQLIEATVDCPSIKQDINRSLYSNDIQKVMKKYNECVGTLSYVKPKDKANNFFYGYVGAAKSFFSVKDFYNNDLTTFAAPVHPSFGVGFELGIIRSINKLSIGIEANTFNGNALVSNDYKLLDGGNEKVDYAITLRGLRTNVLLKYVLSTGKLQPYVRGGIGKSFYSKVDYTRSETTKTTERNLLKSELYLLGCIGLKYKSFFLESRYETGNDLNRTTGEDLKMRRLSVVTGYALPLNKK